MNLFSTMSILPTPCVPLIEKVNFNFNLNNFLLFCIEKYEIKCQKEKQNSRDLVQLGNDLNGLVRQNFTRFAVTHAYGNSPLKLDRDVTGVIWGFFHVTGHRVHVRGGDVVWVLQNPRFVTAIKICRGCASLLGERKNVKKEKFQVFTVSDYCFRN